MAVRFDGGDGRLNTVMRRTPLRCASISEYAALTGIGVAGVVNAIGSYLDSGEAALETVKGEVFLLTGINRYTAGCDIPANLWETLRQHADPHLAFRRWRLLRALERAGWRIELDLRVVMDGLRPVRTAASFGLSVGDIVVPLLDDLEADEIQHPAGAMNDWRKAGAPAVAVTCPAGQLDRFVTAVRLNFTNSGNDRSQVVLLEAPTYGAVVLDSTDPRVLATDITRLWPGGRREQM